MRLTAAFASLLFGLHADGQQTTATQALEANATYRATAERTFLQYESSLSTRCAQIAPDWTRAQQTIYVAPVSDDQKRLVSGIWSERVPGTACGQARRFRALVVVRAGRINLSRQLPGTSNASPALEHDALLAVMGAVTVHHPQEHLQPPIDVLDTTLVGPAPPPPHQTWNEIWLVRVSGKTMRVPIEFVPDATGGGTSFQVNPHDVVDVPELEREPPAR